MNSAGANMPPGFVGVAGDTVQVKEEECHDREAARRRPADGGLNPLRNFCEPAEPGAQPKQRISERHGNKGRQQTQQGVPQQRRRLGQRVGLQPRHLEYRVAAQKVMFHNGGEGGCHNHPRQHGLVQAADQLFEREGDRGNGCVEGRGNARRHAHRGHAPLVLGAETGHAREETAHPGADLHGRTLHPQGRSGAELQRAQDEFSDGFLE
jgi:hypothetical protein